ncbi:hypothetical protein [Cellulosimicrobium composti]|uniref:DUF4435 domain-containing protein n=1 Tax=Cellulosimicrobium composti TaxID=2672572 RepID=A0ABX0BDN9_9MICO|nr:hypothetical protein [Cellulosimicrobium composti]NDO90653.1 hypothetical protein [Cellulosimicrobium composti]
MHVRASDSPVVVVEGPDDALVLKPHLEGAQFFPAAGKPNAIETARDLIESGISDFTCITDPDFDDPLDFADLASVHHPYEGADLEAMLIGLGVLALVLEHTGSRPKIQAAGGPDAVVRLLIRLAAPVSRLRAASRRQAWGIAFDEVEIEKYVDSKGEMRLKVPEYCLALRRRTLDVLRNSDGNVSAVPSDAVMISSCDSDCDADALRFRGKDVLALASVATRRQFGNLSKAASDKDLLCNQLHSSSGLLLSRSNWLAVLKRRVGA